MVSSNPESEITVEASRARLPEKPPRALQLTMDPVRVTSLAGERAQPAPDSVVPLAHYLWLFRRNWMRIALLVVAVTLTSLVISMQMTPIYEATVTIDVDRQTPTGVIGQESNRALTNDSDQFLATQVKMLQSDSVSSTGSGALSSAAAQAVAFSSGRQIYRTTNRTMLPMALDGLKVSRPTNTYLMLVSYRSADPKLASEAVNAIAHSLP